MAYDAVAVHSEWFVRTSPQALEGGTLVAGGKLFADGVSIQPVRISVQEDLHLGVSKRSYDAENNARWVNAVLEGRVVEAGLCAGDDLPVFITRNLSTARKWLAARTAPNRRSGLVASSGALRLRAEGVEAPTFKFLSGIDYPAWFLKPDGDVRSSNQLEVAMSEFELQGLELDNVGLLWGGDLIFPDDRPVTRKFRGSQWIHTATPTPQDDDDGEPGGPGFPSVIDRHTLIRNKYRVLMTRYRKAMVIFIPSSNINDPSRAPLEFDAVAEYLLRCGARNLEG